MKTFSSSSFSIVVPLILLLSFIIILGSPHQHVIVHASGVGVEPPCIGLDFGTSYASVGVWDKKMKQVDIIPNQYGHRTTSTIVAFLEGEDDDTIVVGDDYDAAFYHNNNNVSYLNTKNIIHGTNRLIGRNISTEFNAIQREKSHHLNYNIVSADKHHRAGVQFNHKIFTVEQIASMIIEKIKQNAENFLGMPVKNVVLAVPLRFGPPQRQAMKDALTLAGLNLVRFVPEPSAAVMAYGLENKSERYIVVSDLGGSTFDVTVVTTEDGFIEHLAFGGDAYLGGDVFDARMVDYFVKRINKLDQVDISNDSIALFRLRKACERAKRQLSITTETRVDVDHLTESYNFSETITRAKFEELNMDLFKATIKSIETTLKEAQLNKDGISEVILSGGSCNIPKIKQLVREFFGNLAEEQVLSNIYPEEVVAYGAGVVGAMLSGEERDGGGGGGGGWWGVKTLPLSLGIETAGGVMMSLVERNTIIPLYKSYNFTIIINPSHLSTATTSTIITESTLFIKVYEGERVFTKDNRLLGVLDFSGLVHPRNAKKNSNTSSVVVPSLIEISFHINEDFVLEVSACDRKTGRKEYATFTNTAERRMNDKEDEDFTWQVVENMVTEAEKWKQEDEALLKKMEMKGNERGL